MGSNLPTHDGLDHAPLNARGFSLIELTIVILVIAIIVVSALPKYVDLSNSTKQDAVSSMAAAMTSASSINYAASKAGSSKAKTIANCTDVSNALTTSNPLPTGYTVVSGVVSVNQTVTCTLVHSDGITTATFTAIGTP
jgi:MSHA pilin protein MshA